MREYRSKYHPSHSCPVHLAETLIVKPQISTPTLLWKATLREPSFPWKAAPVKSIEYLNINSNKSTLSSSEQANVYRVWCTQNTQWRLFATTDNQCRGFSSASSARLNADGIGIWAHWHPFVWHREDTVLEIEHAQTTHVSDTKHWTQEAATRTTASMPLGTWCHCSHHCCHLKAGLWAVCLTALEDWFALLFHNK